MSLLRIVAITGAATLALAPSTAVANNRVDWGPRCNDLAHGGYDALRIHGRNLSCDHAHQWVRRIIDHGPDSVHRVHCNVTYQNGFSGPGAGHYHCRGHWETGDANAPLVVVALKFDLFVSKKG